MVYPDYWRDFTCYIPPEERGDLLAAYSRRLNDPDPAVHDPAAAVWDRYETRCSRLLSVGRRRRWRAAGAARDSKRTT